jgi:tRNA G18 (ribose-2'-O)-methylase SpoU
MRKLLNNELERLDLNEFKKAKKSPIIIILDDIRSLNNIGSVFRTADAFLVQEIFLCGITAIPPHREIHKTALGATESVSWSYYNDVSEAIAKAKQLDFKVFAIEQTDKSIMLNDINIKKNEKTAVIFGNEIKGVSDQALPLIDGSIEIPQYGTKHSLNISVCAGIITWELFKKVV